MKALVGIKRVVDYSAQKIKVKNNAVDLANTRMYINPFCEIAMQEAANLKAKKLIKEIVVICIGPKGEKKILWSPMALGGDKAIYVNTQLRHDSDLQPMIVAKTLKHFIERENIDLVFLGKQSVDDDCNQTGQLLGGMMGWPQATFASKVEIKDKNLEVTREVDNGLMTLSMQTPAIVTCDLRLNVPKIAPLPAMMKAKKAPIEQVELDSLNIPKSQVEIIETLEPSKKAGGTMVKDVDQLLEKLQKEAKVL